MYLNLYLNTQVCYSNSIGVNLTAKINLWLKTEIPYESFTYNLLNQDFYYTFVIKAKE